MARNVVLLFDGTWGGSQRRTNILRMRESIDSTGEEDPLQLCRTIGGEHRGWAAAASAVFTRVLSVPLKQGYAWLSRHCGEHDRIFIFGFSRGACTARSCVGLIRQCGLLKATDEASVEAAFALYRNAAIGPEDAGAAQFRRSYSRAARVHFLGVWDTVRGGDCFLWRDTKLPSIVEHAYHAVAVDEHRAHYRPALWTGYVPGVTREVEQRWFIGAHADIGGCNGKAAHGLASIPLRWMQDKAQAAGLALLGKSEVSPTDCLAQLNDSYRQCAWGLYRLVRRRYHRPFGEGISETVDASVWARWHGTPDYRPASLGSHPDRPLAFRRESA